MPQFMPNGAFGVVGVGDIFFMCTINGTFTHSEKTSVSHQSSFFSLFINQSIPQKKKEIKHGLKTHISTANKLPAEQPT